MPHTKNTSDQQVLKRPSLKRIQDVDTYPPFFTLESNLKNRSNADLPTTGVMHWFRNKDLRIEDNTALYAASQRANKENKPLISIYLYCPSLLVQQGISKARLDFLLETLKILQSQLHELNIPLVILTVEQPSKTNEVLMSFLKDHHVSHVYANYEYEVNELNRDIDFIESLNRDVQCYYYHDQCAVPPGVLVNQQKKPFQVFTPYHKAWVSHVNHFSHLIDTRPPPEKQSKTHIKTIEKLLTSCIPKAPTIKQFDKKTDKEYLRELWPAGHGAALDQLDDFIKNHLEHYKETRSQPAKNSGARMSAYLSIGAISTRTILKKIRAHNNNSCDFSLSGSTAGIFAWVREIVFREFYREQLVITPHISMNTPQNVKFTQVRWEKDDKGWQKWCDGQTGSPFIDAGMRQLKKEAYMHNRLRMNVASYLYNSLLLDYRQGERYFAETLIDYDLANNVQGWSPSYTVFNPILQAEKNDPEGEYIRKWVPELKSVKGKAIFDPYHRLSSEEFQKLNYPKPHLDWEKSKQRARERFKQATQKKTPI